MATEIRHSSSLVIASAFLGYAHLVRGDVGAGIPVIERGLALAEEHDVTTGTCANGVYLAWARCLAGDHERGLEHLDRAFERPAIAVMQWTRFGTVTAEIHLAAGRPADARRALAAGRASAAERGALGYRAPLLRLEADILLAEGDVEGAQSHAEQALAVARDLATPPEIGHCHRVLARVSPSPEHASEARRIFDELGMPFWSARVALR